MKATYHSSISFRLGKFTIYLTPFTYKTIFGATRIWACIFSMLSLLIYFGFLYQIDLGFGLNPSPFVLRLNPQLLSLRGIYPPL
jgi:hypothetical protein